MWHCDRANVTTKTFHHTVAEELEVDKEDIKPPVSGTTTPPLRKGEAKSISIKKGVRMTAGKLKSVGKERERRSLLPRRSARKQQEKSILPWLFYR